MAEMQSMGACMLKEARAIRAAFPDAEAMSGLPVSPLPPTAGNGDERAAEYRVALGYLRDEMLLVRSGGAETLTVLDDEIACVERLLPSR